jgi:ABC-type antimicrobial peptide transport system ATPase subunit
MEVLEVRRQLLPVPVVAVLVPQDTWVMVEMVEMVVVLILMELMERGVPLAAVAHPFPEITKMPVAAAGWNY